jgi:hypothetical protein
MSNFVNITYSTIAMDFRMCSLFRAILDAKLYSLCSGCYKHVTEALSYELLV